ncbi:hypothetical protein FACS1894137_09430 [Spirochaetia bacterium]|nr:hypothetical protein FACS1894137_09430 [Spirochaetia bacterium]
MAKKKETSLVQIDSLFNDISALIEKSKQKAISLANYAVNMLFWHVGVRINTEVLKNERAEYGRQVIVNLAECLTVKYGRNYEEKNLRRMMQFAEQFPDKKIVVPVARQLSWSHIVEARERLENRKLLSDT